MLRLKPIGSNQTQVEINGVTVLFSYSTPVAAHFPGVGYVRTGTYHSATTSRHINGWLADSAAGDWVPAVPQEELEYMIEEYSKNGG